VPEQWIREVMRQESDGQEQVVSSAGAMGLMQIMPDTFDELRQRYTLGGDPFEPHDNIMAGAAYIREMYDRYGAPGFLAASMQDRTVWKATSVAATRCPMKPSTMLLR
jgi:soluble lytic murein transglycosylase-like protein